MRPRILAFMVTMACAMSASIRSADAAEQDFFRAHCTSTSDSSVTCSVAELNQFKCDSLSFPSPELSAIAQHESLLVCHRYGQEAGIFNSGCMLGNWTNYIVKSGENFSVLDSRESFAKHFAPVDSEAKANAFVYALTGSFRGDTVQPPLISSNPAVSAAEGQFVVTTFDKQFCGCGTHPISEVSYTVSRSGVVTEVTRKKVRDTTAQGLCVD